MGTFIAAAGKPRSAFASHRPRAEGRWLTSHGASSSLSHGPVTDRRRIRSDNQPTAGVAGPACREPMRRLKLQGGSGGIPLRLWAAAAGDGSSIETEVVDADDAASSSTPAVSSPKERRVNWGSMASELVEVMKFSLPAVGIFLVSPLMTLVDTAFLGAGPAAEQAALNPAGVVLDYPIILLSFLAVGTTSLVAQNPGSKQNTRDVLRPALCLGLLLGVLLLAFTQLGTPQILTSLGIGGDVHQAAMTYIGIRALFCPLVLVCSIAQSAYLASKDVYTPLKLVIISGCINAAGDLLLVGKLGMGVAGAAWATIASQFYLTAGLLFGLHLDGKLPSLLPLPKLKEYSPFSGFAKSITLVNLLKVAGFTAITYYASSFLSTEHLAAQQVLVSIFIFLSLISQPLLQCCQTFLPSLLPGGANADIDKAKSTMTAIFAAALGLGLACGVTGALVTVFCHHIFTSDPVIVGYMNGAVLSMLFCHMVSPIALSVDAVLVAAKDLDALCWIQAVGLATLLGFMSVAVSMGMGLSAIWLAYGTHLLSRLALCIWRIRKIPGLATA